MSVFPESCSPAQIPQCRGEAADLLLDTLLSAFDRATLSIRTDLKRASLGTRRDLAQLQASILSLESLCPPALLSQYFLYLPAALTLTFNAGAVERLSTIRELTLISLLSSVMHIQVGLKLLILPMQAWLSCRQDKEAAGRGAGWRGRAKLRRTVKCLESMLGRTLSCSFLCFLAERFNTFGPDSYDHDRSSLSRQGIKIFRSPSQGREGTDQSAP